MLSLSVLWYNKVHSILFYSCLIHVNPWFAIPRLLTGSVSNIWKHRQTRWLWWPNFCPTARSLIASPHVGVAEPSALWWRIRRMLSRSVLCLLTMKPFAKTARQVLSAESQEHKAFFFSSSEETNNLHSVFYFLFQTLSIGWRSLFCAVQPRRGARPEGSAQSLRENVEPCRKQEAGRSWWIARAPPAQRSPWIEANPVPIHALPWTKTEALRRPSQTSRSAASSWPR